MIVENELTKLQELKIMDFSIFESSGAVAYWLVRCIPKQVVRVRTLGRDIVFCSWVRPLILAVPLTTQFYKWISWKVYAGDSPAMD